MINDIPVPAMFNMDRDEIVKNEKRIAVTRREVSLETSVHGGGAIVYATCKAWGTKQRKKKNP